MSFYSLPKSERIQLTEKISKQLLTDIRTGRNKSLIRYFSDEDTYIRKAAYLAVGKIYHGTDLFQKQILKHLSTLFLHKDAKVRQSTVNAAGEIAMQDFGAAEVF